MNGDHPLDLRAKQLAMAPVGQRLALAAALQADLRTFGVYPASLRSWYRAVGRGELAPVTVPAFTVRGLTYVLGRAMWRAALARRAGPFMFELAPSEASTGGQLFEEYAALALAAAAREGYRGPVFLQGDHFGIEAPQEFDGVLALARRVTSAGFYQLDIDASHLFDLKSSDLAGFHAPNARATARMAAELRGSQPGSRLVLGGAVAEIGGRNTTVADLLAFYQELLRSVPAGLAPLDKVSAQTGTMHGGLIQADGTLGRMPVDIDLATDLGRQARALGLNGLVQHGASTLSLADLARLPEANVVEVHLATQVQNIVFDHPAFPADLLERMRERLLLSDRGAEGEHAAETDSSSEAQRFYRARWTAWGLFRTELLALPEAALGPITECLSAWVADIFQALRAEGLADRVRTYAAEEK
jgi:hypothetical protein